jgi:SAM-dependent methyltransferase
MHPEATEFVVKAIQNCGPFKRVLEVGSRDVNGSIKQHFLDHGTQFYWGVDLEEGPNVDQVMDFGGDPYVMLPGTFDAIVCVNVLEHTPKGADITNAAHWYLNDLNLPPDQGKPGGYFIMSAAYNWPAHGAFDGGMVREGEWYRNVTEEEVDSWLKNAGFTDYQISLDAMMRDVRCLARK